MSDENDVQLIELAAELSSYLSQQLRKNRAYRRQICLLKEQVENYRTQAMDLSAEIQVVRCQAGQRT